MKDITKPLHRRKRVRGYIVAGIAPEDAGRGCCFPQIKTASGLENSQAVRRHTRDRGKNVTTRWQLVAQDLFTENTKLRAENARHKKRMEWYEHRLAGYASNA